MDAEFVPRGLLGTKPKVNFSPASKTGVPRLRVLVTVTRRIPLLGKEVHAAARHMASAAPDAIGYRVTMINPLVAQGVAASADSCYYCGKQGSGFKCCSKCMQAFYCGAECQKKAWKVHKQTCAPPPPKIDLMASMASMQEASDPARMAGSADSCSHCGKEGRDLKRCLRCMHAAYCGAECQKAGWRVHKKTCTPPPPPQSLFDVYGAGGTLHDIYEKIKDANMASNWREVLKYEDRMEQLMLGQPDENCDHLLKSFSQAHMFLASELESHEHARKVVVLEERRVVVLGKMQRFRDQVTTWRARIRDGSRQPARVAAAPVPPPATRSELFTPFQPSIDFP